MDFSQLRPRGKTAWMLGAVAGLALVGGGGAAVAAASSGSGHDGQQRNTAAIPHSAVSASPSAYGPGTATPTPTRHKRAKGLCIGFPPARILFDACCLSANGR